MSDFYLEDLLRDARHYVANFYPQSADEQSEQELLLRRIDDALPEAVPPLVDTCDIGTYCALKKGHEGACDDLPF